MNLFLLLLFVFSSLQCALAQKPTSFAIMEVKSSISTSDICVNYEEFAEKPVPQGPFRMAWWDSNVGNTVVCQPPQTIRRLGPGDIVPIKYDTWPQHLDQQCNRHSFYTQTREPIQYQAEIAKKAGAGALLFLVDRGVPNINGTHDYLHDQFCQPETDSTGNGTVFFVYKDAYEKIIIPKLRASPAVEFRFRKPEQAFDIAIILLWLLILVPVLLGSLWCARAARDRMVRKGSLHLTRTDGIEMRERGARGEASDSAGEKKPFLRTLCWAIVVLVAFILLLILFIRWPDTVVSILWTLLGIFCVSKSLFAICKYCLFAKRRGEQRTLLHFRSFRLTPLGLICYLLAVAICVPWFFIRHHPNAFLLLNLIDVAIAAYGIKYFTYEPMKKGPNLRGQLICSTFFFILGVIFFVYLIFVPTKPSCDPTAPIDGKLDSPGSFMVPMLNDPLGVCWDTEVQMAYRHFAVSMIAVVFSAYFLPFWFLVDFVNEHKAFPYGLVAFAGYALLLLIFFFLTLFFNFITALHLFMLLIMPAPVWAGTIFSLIKGTFSKLFKGELRFE